jgi:hypothetical protein
VCEQDLLACGTARALVSKPVGGGIVLGVMSRPFTAVPWVTDSCCCCRPPNGIYYTCLLPPTGMARPRVWQGKKEARRATQSNMCCIDATTDIRLALLLSLNLQ